jgi:hypothetical protein
MPSISSPHRTVSVPESGVKGAVTTGGAALAPAASSADDNIRIRLSDVLLGMCASL